MKLSKGEKLVLMMLADLLNPGGQSSGINPELVRTAVANNDTWMLDMEYSNLLGESEPRPANVTETINILDMWRFIESGYAKLSKEDKATFKEHAEPFGDDVRFSGFDGNHDDHYGIAHSLIHDMQRFSSFKDHALNSHSQGTLPCYQRMYSVFENIRPNLGDRDLTVAEMVQIFNARTVNKKAA
jgi:uncharacterized protein YfbU (UPF0304 family)